MSGGFADESVNRLHAFHVDSKKPGKLPALLPNEQNPVQFGVGEPAQHPLGDSISRSSDARKRGQSPSCSSSTSKRSYSDEDYALQQVSYSVSIDTGFLIEGDQDVDRAMAYVRWTKRVAEILNFMSVLPPELQSLDWWTDGVICDISWAGKATIRREAEVYCACAMFDAAFTLHYLVWRRLQLEYECPWGDIEHVRLRQSIYCARSATGSGDFVLARHLLERQIVDATLAAVDTTHIQILRLCLADILRQLSNESCMSEQWKAAWVELSFANGMCDVEEPVERRDIFVASRLLHANPVRVSRTNSCHEGATKSAAAGSSARASPTT